jgi:hypothetical protein
LGEIADAIQLRNRILSRREQDHEGAS